MGDKYASVLTVIIGRRQMLTQNANLPCGVANGMWAVVRDVRLHDDAVIQWDKQAGAHRVDATDVAGMVIRYPDRDWGARKLHNDLPVGHFLVDLDYPATAPPGSKQFDMKLGADVKRFRISQFPLVRVCTPDISPAVAQGTLLSYLFAVRCASDASARTHTHTNTHTTPHGRRSAHAHAGACCQRT